ncbi:GntR family transcriptional regulator [Geodermatophilus obscurus]|uniref:Transcriptional regulator, GntR family n=1 Tax=Geodermatophilus obscurus (strain ATCC 25078 / DSM 43160 / JCM 3152 / CCUG 61914 / KCC A-0152 / KCTC 9177 / NBRC 13315 / NRRL B-3577 / G-20) TaxID=526225 RepID=D2SDH4_GEOOG|nr:GntR family transcriptional regulator [Geodermatophilus obscurus]ADB74427.1 transcriptional regulator, GntR family [Geodermatophilus obscurus DSM 43160]
MSIESLSALDRSTLRERSLEALRSAILAGRYRPGDHLGEVELAGSLGVSRGTVREALRHLQQEGLVTAGNRGMLRVNSLTSAEVHELFRVRAALEGLAVREVIASPRRKSAAETLRAAVERLSDEDEPAVRMEADLAFHLLLCQLSGNSMLVEAWQRLEGRMRVAILNGAAWQAPMMARDRHVPIVEAIERGDVEAAVRVVDEHMTAAAQHFAEATDSA